MTSVRHNDRVPRRRVRALLAAASVVVFGAVPAHAAGGRGPSCPTIPEESDQGSMLVGGSPDGLPGSKALDLRSASVGTVGGDLVVSIRVTDLADPDPGAAGHIYTFEFSKETARFALTADLARDGNDFTLSAGDDRSVTQVAQIRGLPDLASNSVRMSVPLALLRRIGATGTVTGLKATTFRALQSVKVDDPVFNVPHYGVNVGEDTATSSHPYRIGTRGCL
ncbi:MAG: hypothetical protein M3O32_01250 [Actinomycetota bacterium]|nr:hypothetical protein [Actinomycetota bacterium]